VNKKQQKQTMKIEEARSANQTAWKYLYEAITLNSIADVVRRYHDDGDCDLVENRVDVLKNMIGERVGNALDAVNAVSEYFNHLKKKEPKETKTKVTPKNLQIAVNQTKNHEVNREINVEHRKNRLVNLEHKRTATHAAA
jgi:hypothetical protein